MKVIGRVILSVIFLVVTGILMSVAAFTPALFFKAYAGFSQQALTAIAGFTDALPFALWEWLAVVIVLLALYYLFRKFRPLAWLTGLAVFLSAGVLVFTALWGLNYFAPSLDSRLEMELSPYSTQTLKETTLYLADRAGQAAEQVERDEQGLMVSDFDSWAAIAGEGYEALSLQDPTFAGGAKTVKRLMSGRLFSYLGFTGIYVPFTGEANVNPEASAASLPFTMCHELAHSKSVAREDEANFCAFLACLNNPDPDFQYSAWYSAFSYTYASLYKVDRAAALEVADRVSDTLRRDCNAAGEHYAKFDGPVQEAAQKVNDLYLKTAGDKSGAESYGEVTDLLVAWYLQQTQ